MSKKALIAVGGNSLIRAGERGAIDEQYANARSTCHSIAYMISRGWDVVVTHGNGPQAGAALLRSERASGEVYTHTLDMCVATTQSEIGYIMQRAMEYELAALGLSKLVLTIPTMVVVDDNDPAFQKPTKPIGPFYSKAMAQQKKRELGWDIVEDAARGYRRVVASPAPVDILEYEAIKKNVDMGIVVIAAGGGGIPVIKKNGMIEGKEAVIDKDRTSALLAAKLGVDLFIISTDAHQVYVDFKTPKQKGIPSISVKELSKFYDEGQFPAGSMGPKVESCIRFTSETKKPSIITSFECLKEALEEKAGTYILPE